MQPSFFDRLTTPTKNGPQFFTNSSLQRTKRSVRNSMQALAGRIDQGKSFLFCLELREGMGSFTHFDEQTHCAVKGYIMH